MLNNLPKVQIIYRIEIRDIFDNYDINSVENILILHTMKYFYTFKFKKTIHNIVYYLARLNECRAMELHQNGWTSI